jgi:hypothetical protein
MKAIGIGLVILLIAFATGLYNAYLNYKWAPKILVPMSDADKQAWANDVLTTANTGLIASMLALIGILIFLVEFMKHQHPHEHETTVPRVPPPPL